MAVRIGDSTDLGLVSGISTRVNVIHRRPLVRSVTANGLSSHGRVVSDRGDRGGDKPVVSVAVSRPIIASGIGPISASFWGPFGRGT